MKNLCAPILAEDLLLVLFQPDSGTIAAENALYYVLAKGRAGRPRLE